MALGPDWTPFVAGEKFNHRDITRRFREMEYWMNGRISASDLSAEPWVESRHIYKPEFYGSPAPRIEAESGDTHYRHRQFNMESRYYRHEPGGWYKEDLLGSDPSLRLLDDSVENPDGLFTPVEGLSASIHLDQPSLVLINAHWYAWESGGDTGYSKQGHKNHALDDRVALFRLYRKGVNEHVGSGSTTRALYGRSDTGYFFRRQSFSTTWLRELDAGVWDFYIGCMYIMKDVDGDGKYTDLGGDKTGHRHKHVYIDGRNFVVDAMRLYK
jgi:hypothetical protein